MFLVEGALEDLHFLLGQVALPHQAQAEEVDRNPLLGPDIVNKACEVPAPDLIDWIEEVGGHGRLFSFEDL